MASLQRRIQEVTVKETRIPIAVIDSMVPRQVLKLEVSYNDDKGFYNLLSKLLKSDNNPTFGVIGVVRLSSGQVVPLQNGVLVEIVLTDTDPIIVRQQKRKQQGQKMDTLTSISSSTSVPEDALPNFNIKLRATKRFRIASPVGKSTDGDWNEAQVQFLNSKDEERAEKQQQQQQQYTQDDSKSVQSYARAVQRCKELTVPNMNMPNYQSLIESWIILAKQKEHFPGQIEQLLLDIGEIPSDDQPTDRAFWVGALINPLPGMGVAMEIRPLLLMAKTSEERINIALSAIYASIRHMDGTKRLF